jgi:hypothetical protein
MFVLLVAVLLSTADLALGDAALTKLMLQASKLAQKSVAGQNAKCASQCPFLLRQAHVKQHGCLVGTFNVSPTLPSSLAVGLFNTTLQGRTSFPALVRFSSGNGNFFVPGYPIKPDDSPDARGMGVKLFGVSGQKALEPGAETSDFIAVTAEKLFLDAGDVLNLALDLVQTAEKNSSLSFYAFLVQHPVLAARLVSFALTGKVDQLQTSDFFTIAPLSIGATPVRYRFQACAGQSLANPDSVSDDFLRRNLEEFFSVQNLTACWTVSAQLYVDETSTPLNELHSVWNVPYVSIAKLVVGPQSFGSVVQEAMCSSVAYHPFNTPLENAPPAASDVQFIRNGVYASEQVLRRSLVGLTANDWNSTTLADYVRAAPNK